MDSSNCFNIGYWIAHHLTAHRLRHRFNLCSSMNSKVATEPFLSRINAIDEKSVLRNHIQRKRQCLAPTERELISTPGFHTKKVAICV